MFPACHAYNFLYLIGNRMKTGSTAGYRTTCILLLIKIRLMYASWQSFFYQENQFNEQVFFQLFVFKLFLSFEGRSFPNYIFVIHYQIWTNAFNMNFLWCLINLETINRTRRVAWSFFQVHTSTYDLET